MNSPEKHMVDESVRLKIRGEREIVCPIKFDEHIRLDDTMMVSASAGSGKTSVLVDRMVALVRKGAPLDSIVAITFTRKAAGELQERFFSQLLSSRNAITRQVQENSHWKEDWKRELYLVNRAIEEAEQIYIGTIHAFCAQILRIGALELGIPPDFEQISEQDEESLRQSFWNRYLHDASTSESTELAVIQDAQIPFEWLFDMFGTLSKNAAVEFEPSMRPKPDPTSAFEFLVGFVQQIALKIPVSNQPDAFLTEIERMRALLSSNQEFDDYFQIEILKLVAGLKTGGKNPSFKIVLKSWGERKSEPYILADSIKKGREELGLSLSFDQFLEERVRPLLEQWNDWLHDSALTFSTDAVQSYRRFRLSSGKLTYDDLLTESLRLLLQVKPVRESLQQRYQHILVDEFQDTDPTQAAMLFSLASSDIQESDWSQSSLIPGRLFLVGDDKQSIYRFRKADFQAFHLVKQSIRSQGGLDLNLTTNFRSDERICKWVNQSLKPRFESSGAPHQAPWEDLQPYKGNLGLTPIVHFKVAKKTKGINLEHQIRGEAAAIARHILDSVAESSNNLDFGDFMILVRRHANIPLYVSALLSAGIPFGITGGRANNISNMLDTFGNLFNALYNPKNGPALIATLRGPHYGVSDQDLFDFTLSGKNVQSILEEANTEQMSQPLAMAVAQLSTLRELFLTKPVHQALEQCLSITGVEALLRVQSDSDVVSGMLQRILELFKGWETKGYGFGRCVQEFDLYRSGALKLESFSERLPFGNCVRIMTIHQAKGLQAPVVFLADVGGGGLKRATMHTWRAGPRVVGKLPVFRDIGFKKMEEIAPFGWEDAVAEERLFDEAESDRLVYVAATRAERQLVISTNEEPGTGSWDVVASGLQNSGYVGEMEQSVHADIPIETVIIEPMLEAGITISDERSGPRGDHTEVQTSLVFDSSTDSWSDERVRTTIERLSTSSWVFLRPSETNNDENGNQINTDPRVRSRTLDSPAGIGLEYGSAMHALFEALVARRKEEVSEEDLKEWARSILRPQFQLAETRSLVDVGVNAIVAFVKSEVWQHVKQASRVLTEVPFTISESQNGQDVVTSGVVDLAFLIGHTWTIVDYKTDQTNEEGLINRHSGQLGAYLRTWSQIFEESQSRVFIWSTHLGRLIPIPTKTEDEHD